MAEDVYLRPNSIPQATFLHNSVLNDETLYGGAAGPGKTWSIVVLPIYHNHHTYGDFRGQIFRETVPQLEEYIIPLTKKFYPLAGGSYNEQKKRWTFPSGAEIKLCYMQHANSWENYASGNNTYQAFDEATMIHEDNYTVETWNRSAPGLGIKPYRVYATNPGGRSHKKFKTEFVDVCKPIKALKPKWSKAARRWWWPMLPGDPVRVMIERDGQREYITRQFIPARIFDNEALLRANPSYLANLMKLPPDKVRKLLDGDWGLVEGQFLEMLREDIHFIHSRQLRVQDDWPAMAGMDYGRWTCAVTGRSDEDHNRYITNEWTEEAKDTSYKAISYRKHQIVNGYYDEGSSKKVKSTICTYGDINMFYTATEQVDRSTPADKFEEQGIWLEQVSKKSPDNRNYRAYTNDVVKDHLSWEKDNTGLYTRKPKLFICYDKCPKLCETLPELPKDKNNPDDIDRESDIDHWYDALKMLLTSWFRYVNPKLYQKARREMDARAARVR